MRVLIVGNDKNYVGFLSKKLNAASFRPEECGTLEDAVKNLRESQFDVFICCLPLLSKSCPFELMNALRAEGVASERLKVILITDNMQLHTAMELMREGVYCCYNRPFPLDQLLQTLEQLNNETEEVVELPTEKPKIASAPAKERMQTKSNERLIFTQKRYVKGISKVANEMYRQIDLVGPTSFSVIVYGETGTGKEAVAHRVATVKDPKAPYIAVDCGCLSKELALSELFGHEKGSFTGAMNKKIGAFELANNGTLFLDEIGNLDYEVQGFLLRAIQERKIRRVGGNEDIVVNTRIVVASNENLAEAVRNGKFREDLYHRLNEFEITVPSLRSRPEDLPLFMQQFLAETNAELGKNVQMPEPEVMRMLQSYSWPGNIRQLKNVMRRACLLARDNEPISLGELPPDMLNGDSLTPSGIVPPEATVEGPVFVGARFKKPRDITIAEIEEALKLANYNKTLAAQYLGIDRKTLYNRLKSHADSSSI